MKFLLFLLTSFCFASTSLADTYLIAEPEVDSKNTQLKRTVRSLLQSNLMKEGQDVTENAEEADWYLESSLLPLGKAYIVGLTKSNSRRKTFSDNLKAQNLEDLDVVIKRLVQAAVEEKTVVDTQKVDSVTKEEMKGTTIKEKVQRQFYIGLGPGGVDNLGDNNAGVAWSLGYLWGLDHQVGLRLNLGGVAAKDSPADMTSFGMGAQYYFSKDKHALYALGMLDYTWAESETLEDGGSCSLFCDYKSDNGWGATAGLGHHFFRTSEVNFALEITYTQGFYNVERHNPSYYALKMVMLW